MKAGFVIRRDLLASDLSNRTEWFVEFGPTTALPERATVFYTRAVAARVAENMGGGWRAVVRAPSARRTRRPWLGPFPETWRNVR